MIASKLSRRQFLKEIPPICAGVCACGTLFPGDILAVPKSDTDRADIKDLIDNKHIFEIKEARFYQKLSHEKIRCEICPRNCEIDHLERGFCGNRENRHGTYYVLAYSNPCAVHPDPIEKKPFFHFLPGSTAFSISTAGCNMVCKFCQNWQISQFRPEQTKNVYLTPQQVADLAVQYGNQSIAYTYAEPVVFYEYMYDTAKVSKKYGLRNVMVSAGYINPTPLRELLTVLDAVKIDLKAFTEKYYREVCSGRLAPVLKTLEVLHDTGTWYEIVYLVVPTLNDSEKEVAKMSEWIRTTLGVDVPIHFSRFYPQYMLKNLPPTPISTLEKLRRIAMDKGLHYVYIGNVPGHEAENTYCPNCNKVVIRRVGYRILEMNLEDGRCKFCSEKIAGVWK